MRTLHTLDYSDAKRMIDLIVEKALQMQKAAAIAVADVHGDLVAFARMDGAPVSSIRIAINKAWTAARERKPTKDIGEKVRHPEKGHDIAYYGDPKYVGWGGGVPVWKDGEVVGAVGVSGLSSAEDASLANSGAELIAGKRTDVSVNEKAPCVSQGARGMGVRACGPVVLKLLSYFGCAV